VSRPFRLGLNRRLRKLIEAGLNGEHQQDVERCDGSLPTFIIIGAAKSATTTLTTILPRHPQIFISKPKEPKFFGRCYDKGWPWYARLFRKARRRPVRGEATTMYASALSGFQQAPALMHRYLPELKLVYVVRHPLDRIESQWRHRSGRKRGTPCFEAMLRSSHLRKLIVGCSLYHERLQSFRAFYPDRQIHCLTFEDLVSQPQATLTELLAFLGASTSPAHVQLLLDDGQLPRVNEAGDKGRQLIPPPTWPPRLRRKLADLLRPDAERMLAYMNKPASTWDL